MNLLAKFQPGKDSSKRTVHAASENLTSISAFQSWVLAARGPGVEGVSPIEVLRLLRSK